MAYKRRIFYVILTLAVTCGNPVSRSQVNIQVINYPQDETSEHSQKAGPKYYITNNAPSDQNSFDLTTANVFVNENTDMSVPEKCEQDGQWDGQSACEVQNITPSQDDQVDYYINNQDYDQLADTSGESTTTENYNQNYDEIKVTSENSEIMKTTSSKSIETLATTSSVFSSTSPSVTPIDDAITTNSILSSTSPTPDTALTSSIQVPISTTSMPVFSSVIPTSLTPDVTTHTSQVAPVLSLNTNQGFLSTTYPNPHVQTGISPTTVRVIPTSPGGSFTTPSVILSNDNGNPTTDSRPQSPIGNPSRGYGDSSPATSSSIPSSYGPYIPASPPSKTASYGPHSPATPPNISPNNRPNSPATLPAIPPGINSPYIPASAPSIPPSNGPCSSAPPPTIPPGIARPYIPASPPGIPPNNQPNSPPDSNFNNPFYGSYNPFRNPPPSPYYGDNGSCTNCGEPYMPPDFRHNPSTFDHSIVPPMWPPFRPSGVPQPMFPPRHFGYSGPFPPRPMPSVIINAWPFGRGGEPLVGFNQWPFTHGGTPPLFPGPVPHGGIDIYGPDGHHRYPNF